MAKFSVVGGSAGQNDSGIFQITTGTGANADNKLTFGVDNTGYSWVQAVKPGDNYKNLLLNPAGGNVGVGTAMLDEKLTVGSFSDSPNIKISRWAFLGQEASHLTTVLGGNARALGANTVVAESTVDGYRAVRMKYNEGITFHAYVGSVMAGDIVENERMRITPQGNIGIGTANPDSLLTMTGSGHAELHIKSGSGHPIVRFYKGGSMEWGILGEYPEVGNLAFYSYDLAGNVLVLTSTGNVGIGTASPSHKLTVNGTIRAKEVIVDTGWADYVFADDYRLAPLSEVEAHIKEHKHLPDMPSAAEVAEKGVSMGEMQTRMLAKLEEVTLHLIRLEKENAALRREVEVLKSRGVP